jgi:hypothetical protein
LCLIFSVLVAACGCSQQKEIAPVSGLITIDGKPLGGGSIVFQPLAAAGSANAGKGSGAFCDEAGRFQLRTLDGRDGAVVGEHRVRIYGPRNQSAASPDSDKGGRKSSEIIPKKYNRDTQLTMTVPPDGITDATFNLTSR